jgi:hypothetical protein
MSLYATTLAGYSSHHPEWAQRRVELLARLEEMTEAFKRDTADIVRGLEDNEVSFHCDLLCCAISDTLTDVKAAIDSVSDTVADWRAEQDERHAADRADHDRDMQDAA